MTIEKTLKKALFDRGFVGGLVTNTQIGWMFGCMEGVFSPLFTKAYCT